MLLSLLADSDALHWSQILVQFPVVGLVFLAVRWMKRSSDRLYAELRSDFKEETERNRQSETRLAARSEQSIEKIEADFKSAVQELKAAHGLALAALQTQHDAELERLQQAHNAHVRSLNSEIRRLVAMLPDRFDEDDR